MRKRNLPGSVQAAVREIQGEWSAEEKQARLIYGVERRSELIAILFGDCAGEEYRQAG